MREYTIILKKSGDQYVSLCLELTVVGCGATKEEAISSVRDAIDSYINSTEAGVFPERHISLELLHEFLSEGEEAPEEEELPRLRVVAYD
ncbi:type II toxin-antitoxin system HicB family antitoxin [Dehalococcoidia bacterium]|nr:type II toxin-antitoxin system HicB family antitoxin [Dehalococcoidia bacterium]MCL0087499.1 type II toxin-antitoxin system HicB family antitoxin [Dehalococcoidia bacterium]MCL0099206.1 type II toxin-antitoxin system HicB family antitoxin [Dehalococcoidia bacterium]